MNKMVQGRIHKWKGDLALLTSAPTDALKHYQLAVEQSKSAGDYLWLAGALV
jgi:hypothetical protein